MRPSLFLPTFFGLATAAPASTPSSQTPLLQHAGTNRTVSPALFSELEELARIVDISYCVGLHGFGISAPFKCLGRCSEFPSFELVNAWNTGQLMSDSCGYIALDHNQKNPRIIVAFRGTYSIANTVVDLSTIPQDYAPYPGETDDESEGEPKCTDCTVHSGFYHSWKVTSAAIIPYLKTVVDEHPNYQLSLVGHSLGGAVAALAGLEFLARGWSPTVTTFGEPRIGNRALMEYIDARFALKDSSSRALRDPTNLPDGADSHLRYRRVTHINDPVPLLPLSEWGYGMHAGEIYISKPSLSPDIVDLQHCAGDEDDSCIAGQDPTLSSTPEHVLSTRSTLGLHEEEFTIAEAVAEVDRADHAGQSKERQWSVPARYRLWELFFAHRDYFWRLGLCVPGGDPWDWGRDKYDSTWV